MKRDFNAKTQRRKGAKSGNEIGSLNNVLCLLIRACMIKFFFASLRLRGFALNSVWLALSLAIISGTGCVSRKQERLDAQRAYAAGQEQAMRARQEQGPVVFVQGPVRNPAVPWQEGMKLSQAVVAAEYTAYMNPMLVRVLRDGKAVGEFKGVDLLHHEDMDLENGDTVVIVP
jgi:hypothetical protein